MVYYGIEAKVMEWCDFILPWIALILNGIVIHICVQFHQLKGADTVIVTLIALLDILYASISIVFQIIKWVKGQQVLFDEGTVCQLYGMFLTFTVIPSVALVSLLTLIRYLAIVHNITIKSKYWFLIATGIILFCSIGCIVGVFHHAYVLTPLSTYCMAWTTGNGFSRIVLFVEIGIGVVASLLISYCYSMITLKYYKIYAKQSLEFTDIHDKEFKRVLTVQKLKLILKMYGLILIYSLEILPSLIFAFLSVFKIHELNVVSDMICNLVLHCISITNPLVVLFLHEETKYQFLRRFTLNPTKGKIQIQNLFDRRKKCGTQVDLNKPIASLSRCETHLFYR